MPLRLIHVQIGVACSYNAPSTNARWSSRSDSIGVLQVSIGTTRLGDEYLQRRDFRVPFDQCGYAAEPDDREVIEIPDCVANRARMRVDENFTILVAIDAVTGEMDLLHVVALYVSEVHASIETVIATADVNIVDVKQQPAAT